MKKAVIGNGYLGSAYAAAGYDLIDFRWTGSLYDHYHKLHDYDVIVNAIGKTDTKWSEELSNYKVLWNVNSEMVEFLSLYCESYGKKFIHLSTGDLYGNNTVWDQNREDSIKLDTNTNYRFTKLAGEKFCNPNDLILRLRLPFDDRDHPKNLIRKVLPFTKFYHFVNNFTYVPDLIKATEILLTNDAKGVYNVVQHEAMSILYLMRNVLKLPHLQHIDLSNENDPNLITKFDNVHVHNDINTEKLREQFIQTPLESAWISSYEKLLANIQNKA